VLFAGDEMNKHVLREAKEELKAGILSSFEKV
jgi:hypothetical protein